MWTDQMVKTLRVLIENEGASFAAAAHAINEEFGTSFSRMACIGKARRSGIAVSEERRRFMGVRTPRKKRGDGGGGLIRRLLVKQERPDEPYPTIVDTDIPLEQRKTIFELTDETCRWPVGEGADLFFCGAQPLPDRPYCGAHCARAYTTRERGWERPDSSCRLRKLNGNISALGRFDSEAA